MPTRPEAEVFLSNLLRERYPKARKATITMDTNLVASGIVDSFSFMEILIAVEKEFGVTIDVGAHEFETLTTMSGLCDAIAGNT